LAKSQSSYPGYVKNKWTLFGFDVKRNDTRSFVLARLAKPRLTGQQFEMVKPFDLKDELRGSFGLYKGKEKVDVVVEFDAWGADDVRPQHWHWSEELTELPKGRLRVKFTLSSLEEVEGWVLSFGEHATVVEPRELKDRLKETAKKVQGKY